MRGKRCLEKAAPMRQKIYSVFVVLAPMLAASQFASAYEVGTHRDMSQAAVSASNVFMDSAVLQDLGISTAKTFQIGNEPGRNIFDLIGAGSVDEDNGLRPRNHFYNPLNNSPLTVLGVQLFNFTSPDWALEDRGQISSLVFETQVFSYVDARGYLLNALTSAGESDRNRNFGLTFLTLGHVIHNVQDMAQPQHVRNDQHLI